MIRIPAETIKSNFIQAWLLLWEKQIRPKEAPTVGLFDVNLLIALASTSFVLNYEPILKGQFVFNELTDATLTEEL